MVMFSCKNFKALKVVMLGLVFHKFAEEVYESLF